MGSRKLSRKDWVFLLWLVPISLLPTVKYSFSMHPAEDAAILMRYSKHLAQGHGIVWNIGEKPVDGGTDFLVLVLMAALAKMGLSLEAAARLLGVVPHILTVIIVYVAVRRLVGAPEWAALISAGYLAIGPGMAYAAACFVTPFFALFIAITWYLALRAVQDTKSGWVPPLFGLSALTMGLIRPGGVFLAVFMLAAIVYMKSFRASGRNIACFLGVFLPLGGAYFLWRWSYFGYPLPNPYYVKGGGTLHWLSLAKSIANAIFLSLPFIWIYILGLRSSRVARQAIFALIPIVGFTLIWVLLSDAMNFLMRFQYPILSIVLISWYPLIRTLSKDWNLPAFQDLSRRSKAVLIGLVVFFACGVLAVQQMGYGLLRRAHDGKYDVAVILREYKGKGYTIATSEAGLLPFYSEWKAIDTWGLSDQWIAHNGGVTESYIDRYKPEIIVFHAGFSPLVPARGSDKWFTMVMALKRYAESRGYILAAAYGQHPHQTHYYYVRPDFPDSMEIVSRIRKMDYHWYLSGTLAFNYATLRRE